MGLRLRSIAATLALAVPIALLVGARPVAAEGGEPSVERLRALVEGYAHAIETNNHELALRYIHPRAPSRPAIDEALRGQLASYLERAQTSALVRLPGPDGTIAVRVEQQIVRVAGLKFMRRTRRSIYHFRPWDGSFRIWQIEALRAPD